MKQPTQDPPRVMTADGTVWTRRAVTHSTGRGLYAPVPVACCPQWVLASLEDLAEHGVRSLSDDSATVDASVQTLRNMLAPTEAPADLTIYRAEHDVIQLGLYTTAAAARAHCEAVTLRDIPGASLDWIEDEADGVAELVAAFGEDERPTGYVVTALTVAAAYDETADE